jgi:hypothetical protein
MAAQNDALQVVPGRNFLYDVLAIRVANRAGDETLQRSIHDGPAHLVSINVYSPLWLTDQGKNLNESVSQAELWTGRRQRSHTFFFAIIRN